MAPAPARAAPGSSILVAPFLSKPPEQTGETFFRRSFNLSLAGSLVLSGSADGTQPFWVDDVMDVSVRRPDGTRERLTHDFSRGCSGTIEPAGPFDLAPLLDPRMDRVNQVTITLKDQCGGGNEGNSEIWLSGDFTQDLAVVSASPEFKAVQWVDRLSARRCARELSSNLGIRHALALTACEALATSVNDVPPTSFTRQSWNAFKRSKEYRAFLVVPPVRLVCAGGEVRRFRRLGSFDYSKGYTKTPLPRSLRFTAGERYSGRFADAFYRPSVRERLDGRSVQISYLVAGRIATAERATAHRLLGYDAPFIWMGVRATLHCDGSYTATFARTTFPSWRLYRNDRQIMKAQQQDLTDFVRSGGRNFHRPGRGNLYLGCEIRQVAFRTAISNPLPRRPGPNDCLDFITGGVA